MFCERTEAAPAKTAPVGGDGPTNGLEGGDWATEIWVFSSREVAAEPAVEIFCVVENPTTDDLHMAMQEGFANILPAPLDEEKAIVIVEHVAKIRARTD